MTNVSLKFGITLKTNLVDYANSADICLGIFGNSNKANNVIPHKAFETLSIKKPLITKNTDAITEILTNNKDCILVKNDNELANAILRLKNDKKLRLNIAENGYKLYSKNYNNKEIGKRLIEVIKK